MTDRRDFVGAVAGGLLVASTPGRAQAPARLTRVGYLAIATSEQAAPLYAELVAGLRALGYVEGRNLVLETRYGDGTTTGLPELAADLVRARVDVIVGGSAPITAAAKAATTTIPIVMVATLNPVGEGFVASLARPGGNITGLSIDASPEILGKNLDLLVELIPGLGQLGVLRQANHPPEHLALLQSAAKRLNVGLQTVVIGGVDEVERGFAALAAKRVGAVMVLGPIFYARRKQVADLALRHRLPAMTTLKEFAQAGLFMTYGPDLRDLYRRAAFYVDRIARGERPADMPVERPTKFELVINLRTAQALNLAVPQSMLLRADEVIR